MDVNYSTCPHCGRKIHYAEARLLPEGGGVCPDCAQKHGYRSCDECQDYFIPDGEENICDVCMKRIFERFI
jgi:hypothetical protein